MESRLPQLQDTKSISPVPLADIDSEEENAAADEDNEDVSQQQQQTVNNRYSYRAAIYSNGNTLDIGGCDGIK